MLSLIAKKPMTPLSLVSNGEVWENCPACERTLARPYAAVSHGGHVLRTAYRCTHCDHSWEVGHDTPSGGDSQEEPGAE